MSIYNSHKWYDNDWVLCILAAIGMMVTVFGNYIYHGGCVVW